MENIDQILEDGKRIFELGNEIPKLVRLYSHASEGQLGDKLKKIVFCCVELKDYKNKYSNSNFIQDTINKIRTSFSEPIPTEVYERFFPSN